jgi:hypothetical protein
MSGRDQAIATHNNGEPHIFIDSGRNTLLTVPHSARHDANANHGNIRPDLTWDDNLANDAANWANYLASIDSLDHSPNDSRPNQGENLSSYSGTFATADLNFGAEQWASEQAKYNGEKIGEGNFEDWGHYTQVCNPHSFTRHTRPSGRKETGRLSGSDLCSVRLTICR